MNVISINNTPVTNDVKFKWHGMIIWSICNAHFQNERKHES